MSETQTITPHFLCGCGAPAVVSIQFPYEQPRFFCDRDRANQPTSKEVEPGRAMVASVVYLDGRPEPSPERPPTELALADENAALRARLQELEEQLEIATAPMLPAFDAVEEPTTRVD